MSGRCRSPLALLHDSGRLCNSSPTPVKAQSRLGLGRLGLIPPQALGLDKSGSSPGHEGPLADSACCRCWRQQSERLQQQLTMQQQQQQQLEQEWRIAAARHALEARCAVERCAALTGEVCALQGELHAARGEVATLQSEVDRLSAALDLLVPTLEESTREAETAPSLTRKACETRISAMPSALGHAPKSEGGENWRSDAETKKGGDGSAVRVDREEQDESRPANQNQTPQHHAGTPVFHKTRQASTKLLWPKLPILTSPLSTPRSRVAGLAPTGGGAPSESTGRCPPKLNANLLHNCGTLR